MNYVQFFNFVCFVQFRPFCLIFQFCPFVIFQIVSFKNWLKIPILFSSLFLDAEGRTYLFDLDFNQGNDNPYTVDAAYYGNVSHFINHSCDANLAVFNVWINCMDPDLPRLALFAIRDIVKGEQLTFDYRQRPGADDSMESIQSGEEAGMECKCGSSNCRKVMFH